MSRDEGAPAKPGSMPREAGRKAWRWLALGLAGLLVVSYYGWIVGPSVPQLSGPDPADAYYNLLVDGFRDGHLSLKKTPAPELAALADPYDPAQNAPWRLHDASYFQGKYYLYFGVAPALGLFLPYTLLTGHHLSHAQAVGFFSSAGFLAAVGLFGGLARRHFPAVPAAVAGGAALGLGLATATPVMLRRPEVWEVPISSGYCFAMLMLAAVVGALGARAPRRRLAFLAAASLACGLAVASRPSYALTAAVLLGPVWSRWREAGRGGLAARLAAAAVPLGLAGLGLMLYNRLRFGSVFEFGAHYQLGGSSQAGMTLFSLGSLGYTLRLYFLEPVHWAGYFPYVEPVQPPPAPSPAFGVENTFGILTGTPFAWLALAAPLAARGRTGAARREVNGLVGTLAGFFVLCALPICLFAAGACVRYQVDFDPVLVLLAALGVLGLERAAAGTRWRLPLRVVWVGLLAWSAVFTFAAGCRYWDLLRKQAPETYRTLARLGNYPAYWLERWRGLQPGPWEIRLRFPPYTGPRFEPLLVTGSGVAVDYVYVQYTGPNSVMLGLEHTGYGGPVAGPITVDYGVEHTLVIETGALYPPAEHPYFPDPEAPEVQQRRRTLAIKLDGHVLLNRSLPFYDAAPQNRWLGSNPYAQAFGRAFTGTILERRTLAAPELPGFRRSGSVLLDVRFDRLAVGQGQPLVVTGVTGQGDLVYVRLQADGRLVFGLDHWGGRGKESEPLAVPRGESRHRLQVRLGSLLPPGAPAEARRRLEITLDGREVLAGEFDFHPATASQIHVGYNPIGGSTATLQFTGELNELPEGKE